MNKVDKLILKSLRVLLAANTQEYPENLYDRDNCMKEIDKEVKSN